MPFPASYPNWVFSLFSGLGFVVCCIPFPWHLEAWNTGTCLYMAWSGLGCLTLFINSIIWNGNAINWAPVWCDITTKLLLGVNFAIPAASLCINRRLYHIASVRTVTISKAEKRRQIMVDLLIGLGIPILFMILQYIPQGHRFNIWEDVGCITFTYSTWVAFVLVNSPPLVLGLASGTYAILSIRAFWKSRLQSKEMLSAYSNLTSSRYLRLMALAGTDIIGTVPLSTWVIVNNARGRVSPWISWEDTHSGFSRVDQIPAMIWRASPVLETGIEMTRWSPVACAIVFFIYFGFADEARKHYRSAVSSVAKRVGVSTGSFGNSSGLFSSAQYVSAISLDHQKLTGSIIRMSKGGVGSHPGSIPAFGTEKIARKNSYESFSDASSDLKDSGSLTVPSTPVIDEKNTSFSNIFSSKKKLNEEVFKPDFKYDNLVLPDIGGTLANSSSDEISSEPTSGSSAAPSISIPEPAVTRSADPRRHSHDMV